MLFGSKEPLGKTFLLLDIENGSAATALVRLHPHEQPKLFAEMRAHTPLYSTVTGATLSAEVEHAVMRSLQNAAEVAARVRNHEAAHNLGTIDFVTVFLAPPWGTPNLADGKPTFLHSMQDFVRRNLGRFFGDKPVSFYTSAGSAAFATRSLVTSEPCLVCSVTGEVSELLHMDEEGVVGHATIPTGTHGFMRTLRTHGALSEAEARSAMRLPSDVSRLLEPSRAAGEEFATHFADATRDLLGGHDVRRVVIVAGESAAERIARALESHGQLAELFPHGGEVRALRTHHATPYVAAHAQSPDLHLLLEALFVDNHFNTVVK
jgi:hypothetical protein